MARVRKKRTSWHRKQPVPLARAVGQHIRTLAAERGFNFDAIIGETELSRGYFSQLTRGMVVPGIVVLRRIADALQTTLPHVVMTEDGPAERAYEIALKLSRPRAELLVKEARRLLNAQEAETSAEE